MSSLLQALFIPPAPRIQAGQCGDQMGATFLEAVRDENGIRGGGEYCGDNNTQLGRINVLYHETSSSKYVPRAVLFDLKRGVIDAARALPLGELFCP